MNSTCPDLLVRIGNRVVQPVVGVVCILGGYVIPGLHPGLFVLDPFRVAGVEPLSNAKTQQSRMVWSRWADCVEFGDWFSGVLGSDRKGVG